MSDSRFDRLIGILSRVLDLDPRERPAALERECGADLDLRDTIESLLAGGQDLPGILATGGASALTDLLPESFSGPGSTASVPEPEWSIGPYRVIEKLGEGGMGTVYLGEQEDPIRRRVAIKLIKRGMDTESVIARFGAERQALAIMNHPSIAKVYEAGATDDGRPYFVMEYVAGIPITKYCDRHELGTRERCRLLIDVCQAIHHAHQKGVVHRDVKPSNVLVREEGGRPLPMVIDFGVAKATEQRLTERTLFTEHGQLVGTPEYMSPEQAAGSAEGVDARTDVYSLGVLLYELLTGALPFDSITLRAAGFDEIRRVIRETEPVRPSTRVGSGTADAGTTASRRRSSVGALVRQIRGDLDWITMRAMDKAPDRRYPSASELAEDLRRHLDGEPVEAGPPSARYRLSKAVRKHRLAFASAAAVLVALVAGLVSSTTLYFRAEAARLEATTERERAERVIDFQQEMLEQANPYQAPGRELTVREVLDTAVSGARASLADDPAVRSGLLRVVGRSYRALGRYGEAEDVLREALEIDRRVRGPEDAETAATLFSLGSVLADENRLEESAEFQRESLAIRQARFGEQHRFTADCLAALARVALEGGDLDEAEALDRRELEIRRAVAEPGDVAVARSLSNLGAIQLDRGDYERAEALFRESLERRAATGGPSDPELAVTMTNLAIALRRLDRPAEAESLYQESLAQQLEIFGEEHLSVVETLNSLGALQTNYGDPVESEETLRRSLRLCRAMFPDGHRQTAVALNNLGYLLQAEGRVPEAETLYRESLEMRKRVLGPDHPDVGTALNNLGRAVRDQGRYEDAVALFRESIALRKRTLGDRHIQVATASSNLAKLLETMARDATGAPRAVRLKEAEDLARESLSIRRGAFDGDHSRVVTGLAVLARVVAARGRPAAAESLYVESIDMVRRLGAGDREAICPLLEGRANLLMDRGAHDLAIPLLAESAAVRERNHPPGHRRIARVQGALGECYAVAGRYAEAESLLVASHAAFSSADRSPGADLVKARARLVDLYERMGTSGKAAPYRPEPPGPDGRD